MSARTRRTSPLLYLFVGLFMVVTVLTCLGIAHQDWVLVTYHSILFDRSTSTDDESAKWLVESPSLSLPPLVAKLKRADANTCERTGKLLGRILDEHPDPTDPEHAQLSLHLASMLQKNYHSFSPAGKREAVRLAYDILEQHLGQWSPNVATALETAGEVVKFSLRDMDLSINLASLAELPGSGNGKGSTMSSRISFEVFRSGRITARSTFWRGSRRTFGWRPRQRSEVRSIIGEIPSCLN